MSVNARTRREVLRMLRAVGTATLVADSQSAGQEAPRIARLIDVHHHFFSQKLLGDMIERLPNPGPMREYTPQRSLEAMDRAGIATAMLSGTTVPEDAARVARLMNEYGATLRSDHPGRFGLFAVLPLPDVDTSLREIEYAFETLKADGVAVLTSYENHWLGESMFQPVFDELNRRHAIVFAHPTVAPCCQNLIPGARPESVEFNTDTSRAIWSLLNDLDFPTGATRPSMATRYSNVTFVWSHAGGSLLGLIGRFLGSAASAENLAKSPAPGSRLYHLRRFYYDTAGSANPIEMQALKALVGSSQILFGSDFPFVDSLNVARALQQCGFGSDELRSIKSGNGSKLLKLPRAK
jgi:predicted TIM-barrel fold metal-dependent hydrolase